VLRPRGKESRKGKGFVQPLTAHEHWHIDVAYINIAGTFVFMAIVIDGFSRLVVAWDIAPQMGEKEIEILLQQGRERFPERVRGSSRTTVRSSSRMTSHSILKAMARSNAITGRSRASAFVLRRH
jgi:hypothetical protein